MTWRTPPELRLPVNAGVLRYLESAQPSAHGDLAEELARAVEGLAGVSTVSPDVARCAWVAACTREKRVFALARGMRSLAVRLAADLVAAALADRGAACPELGPGWVEFDPFLADERTPITRERVRRWCGTAFRHE